MPIDHSRPTTVIFGCGYVGSRLARTLLSEGNPVRACSRHLEKLAPLADLGAELFPIDAAKMKQFGPALRGLMSPMVVYSIPPVPGLPGGESVRRATQAALNGGARSFVYLGTSGLYGTSPDADWIDEDTPIALDDLDMASRFQDESAVESAALAGLRTVILRLAAIYGPGKGVRKRLLGGKYKLVDDGRNWVSRIHVDDVVQVIRAAAERGPQGAIYMAADDKPTTQREYTEWLCKRLKLPLPATVASIAPGAPRTFLRGRRIRNDKMKRELGLELIYPTYIEGEQQIEAEVEAGVPVMPLSGDTSSIVVASAETEPQSAPTAAAGSSVSAPLRLEPTARVTARAQSIAIPTIPRPACIRHVTQAPIELGRDEVSGEELAHRASLGRVLGMRRLALVHVVLDPGHRTAWPHAHSREEEMWYVVDGTPELWLDGVAYPLVPGDAIGFPSGSGSAHTILNNSDAPVKLLVFGEQGITDDRVTYPQHPERDAALAADRRWDDPPRQPLGPHDGLPDAARVRPS